MTLTEIQPPVVILGAGIAGLSAAFFLQQHGVRTVVLERSATYGGLARSFRWNGFWCDFAAHRLFTQDAQVLEQIRSLVQLRHHERRSKIYLNGTWMSDPIDVVDLVTHHPIKDVLRLAITYLARNRNLSEDSFEHYVLKWYGQHFYDLFFRSYTERLFGLCGDQIAVEWARRKVRLASPIDRFKRATKTKFAAFFYPECGGYGAIADAFFDAVREQVILGARVTGFETAEDGKIQAVYYEQAGEQQRVAAERVISTLPLTLNARFMSLDIRLDYQKVDAVYVLLNKPQMTDNHWLYFMDSQSVINRAVEFKNMSPVETDPDRTVVCAEVTKDVQDPVTEVINNLVETGLIRRDEVLDTHVVREPFAYPRYTKGYPASLKMFDEQLQAYPNLHILGRAAQFEHHEVDDLIGAAYGLVNRIMMTQGQADVAEMSEQLPLVSIVVLAWNNYEDTAECLASLRKLNYRRYEIVLVDNGSTDGTPERVRSEFPEVTVIENGANLGVPRGYNVGFRYALEHGADHVFMINNDTTVDPMLLDYLVKAAQAPSAGILSPIVYYYDQPNRVWASGARYRRFPPAIVMETRVFSDVQQLEYAISCGLLITRRAFERAGLFDENYRFFWDDYDFSQRVRDAELTILQVPQAKMWHKVSRTTAPGSELFWQVHGESGAIFHRRHRRNALLSTAVHLSYFALREFVLKRRLRFLKAYWMGLRHGFKRPLHDVPRVKNNVSYPG